MILGVWFPFNLIMLFYAVTCQVPRAITSSLGCPVYDDLCPISGPGFYAM